MTDEQKPNEPSIDAHLPVPKSPWWRAALFGAVLLLCGAAIGSAATMQFVRQKAVEARNNPGHFPDRVVDRMTRNLDLSAEQATQIRAIFENNHETLRSIRRESRQRMDEVFAEIRGEVTAVLTPEQAEKWKASFERARKHSFPRHDRDGGHRPPPRDGERPPPPR